MDRRAWGLQYMESQRVGYDWETEHACIGSLCLKKNKEKEGINIGKENAKNLIHEDDKII